MLGPEATAGSWLAVVAGAVRAPLEPGWRLWQVSDPGIRDCTRSTLFLEYGMGHGPRSTSVVTTRNAVRLLIQ
jgi:hypothetical protein